MTETEHRELAVERGAVECLPGVRVGLDRCRFCASSRAFRERGTWKRSPALAYCMACRVTEDVDLSKVEAVRCADRTGEGFRSIISVIS